ncbi:MAG: nuclease-related domain-containing protein [Crocosphaera sp.]
MKIVKQSPRLREYFNDKINNKNTDRRQRISEELGGGILGTIGSSFWQFEQMKNQVKGALGENLVSMLAISLSDNWVIFKNALIPTDRGSLTEVDLLLIGENGIFLIEVKTWKGSWTAYQDKWKHRKGSRWVPVENSPTLQSLYHKKMFEKWIHSAVKNLPSELILAPVIFPVAKWLGVNRCSVPVCHGLPELRQFIQQKNYRLNYTTIQQVTTLIKDLDLGSLNLSKKPKPILKKR